MWVPIGALAGGLGAAGGSAFAAVATPLDEDADVEAVADWWRAAFAVPLLRGGRLTTPALSVAGAADIAAGPFCQLSKRARILALNDSVVSA